MNASIIVFVRGLLGYCPNCGQRRMFRGIYALHDCCPACGMQFENKPGDFTGAAYLSSGIAGFIGVMLGLGGGLLTDYSVFAILSAAVPVVIIVATLLHRPIKGS